MNNITSTICYGIVAGLASCVGVFLLLYREKWARRHTNNLNSFAAGAILGAVFLHLFPGAVSVVGKDAFFWGLVGFFIFYILENMVVIHSGAEKFYLEHDEHHHLSSSALVASIGIGLHSLIDGLVIGVGFDINRHIGSIATIGVILHELPEGMAIFSVLLESSISRNKAIFYSVVVALATPLGAILSIFFLSGLTEHTVGVLLALGAGTFLYVAASDLIPATHLKTNKFSAISLTSGLVFLYLMARFFPE